MLSFLRKTKNLGKNGKKPTKPKGQMFNPKSKNVGATHASEHTDLGVLGLAQLVERAPRPTHVLNLVLVLVEHAGREGDAAQG